MFGISVLYPHLVCFVLFCFIYPSFLVIFACVFLFPPPSVGSHLHEKVEGRAGVARMEACEHLLPSSAWRVVILGSGCEDETELEGLVKSSTFLDSAAKTIVVVVSVQVWWTPLGTTGDDS